MPFFETLDQVICVDNGVVLYPACLTLDFSSRRGEMHAWKGSRQPGGSPGQHDHRLQALVQQRTQDIRMIVGTVEGTC